MSAYVNIKVLEIKFFYFESITPISIECNGNEFKILQHDRNKIWRFKNSTI